MRDRSYFDESPAVFENIQCDSGQLTTNRQPKFNILKNKENKYKNQDEGNKRFNKNINNDESDEEGYSDLFLPTHVYAEEDFKSQN